MCDKRVRDSKRAHADCFHILWTISTRLWCASARSSRSFASIVFVCAGWNSKTITPAVPYSWVATAFRMEMLLCAKLCCAVLCHCHFLFALVVVWWWCRFYRGIRTMTEWDGYIINLKWLDKACKRTLGTPYSCIYRKVRFERQKGKNRRAGCFANKRALFGADAVCVCVWAF